VDESFEVNDELQEDDHNPYSLFKPAKINHETEEDSSFYSNLENKRSTSKVTNPTPLL